MKKKKSDIKKQPAVEAAAIIADASQDNAERHERFCLEMAIHGNGTKACINAGYSAKSASQQACRLLGYPKIQKRLNELLSITAQNLNITRHKVMQRFDRIAGFDVKRIYKEGNRLKDIDELTDDEAAGIAGIEVTSILEGFGTITKVKIRDTKAANDSLVKMLGWNAPEKIDITSDGDKIGSEGIEHLDPEERLQLFRLKQKMASGG